MATAIAARHVYKHRGTGPTGHCRPACAAGWPRRRQRPTGLEHCSNAVFDGLPAQTIWLKFPPETSEVKHKSNSSWTHSNPGTWKLVLILKWKTDGLVATLSATKDSTKIWNGLYCITWNTILRIPDPE